MNDKKTTANPALSLPSLIKDLNWTSVMNVVFYNSITSMSLSPLAIHSENKCLYPFVLESFYEYVMRFNENGSTELDSQTLGKIAEIIFTNPKVILDRDGTDNLMTLFSLWQMEDQHYMFSRMFRYNWFFSFKNDKVDMQKAFRAKFGCDYVSFMVFCVINYISYLGLRNCEEKDRAYYSNLIKLVLIQFPCVTTNLSLNRKKYIEYSKVVCKRSEDLIYSLKISKLYPFVNDGDNIMCYMPHTIIPACTSSLL